MSKTIPGGRGFSLHIGVNHVDPAHYDGWDGQLVACEADARAMAALAEKSGFAAELLLTAAATREVVLDRLARAASDARPGDIVMLTYAGHGGQIQDWSGDEADRMDETWCLFDSQLIDDEIFTCLGRFAAGVRIVMISDSCHSGTVFRGERAAARTVTAAVPRIRAMPSSIARRTYERNENHYRTTEQGLFAREWKSVRQEFAFPVAAAAVHLSGCMDHQFSHDGDTNGHFTEKLLEVWAEGAFTGTHSALHREVLKRVRPDQTPQLARFGGGDPAFDTQRAFAI